MANIRIFIQVGRYPSQNDVELEYILPEELAYQAFEPLDHPSKNCDAFTRYAICSPTAKIIEVKANRLKVAKLLSEVFIEGFQKAFGSVDTVMGYKEKFKIAKEYEDYPTCWIDK